MRLLDDAQELWAVSREARMWPSPGTMSRINALETLCHHDQIKARCHELRQICGGGDNAKCN